MSRPTISDTQLSSCLAGNFLYLTHTHVRACLYVKMCTLVVYACVYNIFVYIYPCVSASGVGKSTHLNTCKQAVGQQISNMFHTHSIYAYCISCVCVYLCNAYLSHARHQSRLSTIQEEHEAVCQGVVFQVQTEELGSHQDIKCRHQTSQNRSQPTNHTSKHLRRDHPFMDAQSTLGSPTPVGFFPFLIGEVPKTSTNHLDYHMWWYVMTFCGCPLYS